MIHSPIPISLFLSLSFLFYLFYEYRVISVHYKSELADALSSRSEEVRQFSQTRKGMIFMHFIHLFNIGVAFCLLVFLFYFNYLGVAFFFAYQLFFFLKNSPNRLKDYVLYTLYHTPIYFSLIYTFYARGGIS